MPGGYVARATIVLTMDDGRRAVYLLEGDSNSEATVSMDVNEREIPGQLLVRHVVESYNLTLELRNMIANEVKTEDPSAPALETGTAEITDSARP